MHARQRKFTCVKKLYQKLLLRENHRNTQNSEIIVFKCTQKSLQFYTATASISKCMTV